MLLQARGGNDLQIKRNNENLKRQRKRKQTTDNINNCRLLLIISPYMKLNESMKEDK